MTQKKPIVIRDCYTLTISSRYKRRQLRTSNIPRSPLKQAQRHYRLKTIDRRELLLRHVELSISILLADIRKFDAHGGASRSLGNLKSARLGGKADVVRLRNDNLLGGRRGFLLDKAQLARLESHGSSKGPQFFGNMIDLRPGVVPGRIVAKCSHCQVMQPVGTLRWRWLYDVKISTGIAPFALPIESKNGACSVRNAGRGGSNRSRMIISKSSRVGGVLRLGEREVAEVFKHRINHIDSIVGLSGIDWIMAVPAILAKYTGALGKVAAGNVVIPGAHLKGVSWLEAN